MELEVELRIVKDGERAFGLGPLVLLEKIDKLGSLNKACKDLNMSYSKAWSIIKRAEKLLGFPLITTQAGGIDGGGSLLTKEARSLIKDYRDFYEEAEESLDLLYEKYFGDI